MARVRIGPASSDRKTLNVELARLRELDVAELRARWHTLFRQKPPSHLPRHLLYRILAYRIQADQLGDLDTESKQLLDRAESPEQVGQRAVAQGRRVAEIKRATGLGRGWNGRMQRLAVLA